MDKTCKGRTKIALSGTAIILLIVGFLYVALQEFPADSQPVQEELSHAIMLPDTQ